MQKAENQKTTRFATYVGMFFLGALITWLSTNFLLPDNNQSANSSIRQGGYTFINPLLECDADGGLESKSLRTQERAVEDLITSLTASHKVNHVSVYFRDLNNGPWFGINEDETFTPASLLKVPVMIAYFHAAETDPDILNEMITFQSPTVNSSHKLEQETSYSVDELITYMIKDSDNDAFSLLVENIENEKINKTLQDIGLVVPNETTPEDYITVRSYASLFRVLFNASYLSRDLSERALSLLSTTTFNEGIRSGIPDSIPVASKFGIRANETSKERQLHDCGIVYYPDHPYLLCIMTRGDDLKNLTTAIGNISKQIYDSTAEAYSE